MRGKRKPGRPKVVPREQRTALVTALLKPKERAALKRLAEKQQQSLSSTVREAVLKMLRAASKGLRL